MKKAETTYQLSGQKGHKLDDGQSHSPFSVLCQVDDGREEVLRELRRTDYLIHLQIAQVSI